ncbi:PGF-pre-PGF domain-containing protein [Haloferax sp. YSMS24]|uniref:PGF-pre-PGF domain-containing protein n=1 Tax=Haloferax sp. YSMS24 TaxID=3388425 RepID=UPI00398CBB37
MSAGSGVDIDTLTLTMSRDLPAFAVDVKTFTEKPGNVTTVTEANEMPLYLEIDVNRGLSRYLDGATVDLTVGKSDLDARQTAPENVALYRYHEENWERLETRLVQENDGRYVLRAESPGTSYFALGIRQPVASVSNVTTESKVLVGEPTTITATVTNTGFVDGPVSVDLRIDGDVVSNQSLTLQSGENATVTFEHEFETPGTFPVMVGDESVETTVGEQFADVRLVDVKTDARTIGPGENVTLIATITNRGTIDGSLPVTYGIADGDTETQTVTVASGQTRVVTLEQQLSSPGEYSLVVNGQVVSVTVEAGSSKLSTPDPDSANNGASQNGWGIEGVGVLPFVLAGVAVLVGVGLLMKRR